VLLNGTTVLNATVTVTTTAPSGIASRPQPPAPPWMGVWILALLSAVGVWMMGGRRFAWYRACAPLVVVLGLTLWAACGGGGGGGGGGSPGTPAGTYTLTVTGTYISALTTLQHNLSLTLVVN
jgi:hypothetical protein